MPKTRAHHEHSLEDPAVCELLKIRDFLDNVMVRTDGCYVAGFRVAGAITYFGDDDERNEAKSVLESLLRAMPEQSMRLQFRYEVVESLNGLLDQYQKDSRCENVEVKALDKQRLAVWSEKEKQGTYLTRLAAVYLIWDPAKHKRALLAGGAPMSKEDRRRAHGGFTISQGAAHLIVRLPATEEFPNGRIAVLDEFLEPHVTAKDFARELLQKWFLEDVDGEWRIPEKPRHINAWVTSPDAFRKDGVVNEQDVPFSRLEQMNDVIGAYGFSFIRANDDRKGGWMLLYQMLRDGELIIADHCRHTRDMLMSRVRDPKKFDDIQKVSGDPLDDVADSLRYAIMTFPAEGVRPREEKVQEIMEALDPTNAMIAIKRLEIEEREEQAPVFIGRAKARGMMRPGPRRPW